MPSDEDKNQDQGMLRYLMTALFESGVLLEPQDAGIMMVGSIPSGTNRYLNITTSGGCCGDPFVLISLASRVVGECLFRVDKEYADDPDLQKIARTIAMLGLRQGLGKSTKTKNFPVEDQDNEE